MVDLPDGPKQHCNDLERVISIVRALLCVFVCHLLVFIFLQIYRVVCSRSGKGKMNEIN